MHTGHTAWEAVAISLGRLTTSPEVNAGTFRPSVFRTEIDFVRNGVEIDLEAHNLAYSSNW